MERPPSRVVRIRCDDMHQIRFNQPATELRNFLPEDTDIATRSQLRQRASLNERQQCIRIRDDGWLRSGWTMTGVTPF